MTTDMSKRYRNSSFGRKGEFNVNYSVDQIRLHHHLLKKHSKIVKASQNNSGFGWDNDAELILLMMADGTSILRSILFNFIHLACLFNYYYCSYYTYLQAYPGGKKVIQQEFSTLQCA